MKRLVMASIFLLSVSSYAEGDPRGILELQGYGTSDSVGVKAKRTRGDFGEKEAVVSDDKLLFLNGYGYNGSAVTTTPRAAITFNANQTWTSTANGTYISLQATPNSSTTQAEVVRIGNNGASYLKITPDLDISVTTPTAIGQIGITSAGVVYVSTGSTLVSHWSKIGAQ